MSTQIDLGLRLFLMDGASAGLGSFAGTLMHMGLAAQNAGNSFSQLSPWVRGAGLVAAGAGLAFGMFVGAIQYSTDAAKELETAVTTVVQNVDGAKDHIDEIRQVIINLGSASIYSSQQVADGFAALGQKGITASDIIHTSIGQSMIWLAEAMGQDGTTGAANLLGSTLHPEDRPHRAPAAPAGSA